MDYKGLVPKQTKLTENETPTSFNIWVDSVNFHTILDNRFERFTIKDDLGEWKPSAVTNRGYTNDGESVAENVRLTAVQKCAYLKILLGSIASWAPVISNQWITEESTSLNSIYDKLRAHYHFRKTGSRILDISSFKLNQNESREALWERMLAFVQDNLLTSTCGIQHMGKPVTVNETLSPTILNILVSLWLKTIHKDLPDTVKQKFSTQLRTNTLASLRDEISDSLAAIIQEMEDRDAVSTQSALQVSRASFPLRVNSQRGSYPRNNYQQRGTVSRGGYKPNSRGSFGGARKAKCCLCDTAGRPSNHFLSQCTFLPPDDRQYLSRTREVFTIDGDEEYDDYEFQDTGESYDGASANSVTSSEPSINAGRVDVIPSAVLEAEWNQLPLNITIDSGAESNLITEEECRIKGITIHPSSQKAVQADGETVLPVAGEVQFNITKDHHTLVFNGLVVKKLSRPILAGMPFLTSNDVFTRPSINTIYIGDCCAFEYEPQKLKGPSKARLTVILRAPQQTCLLPGEEMSVKIPSTFQHKEVAVEPRMDSPSCQKVPGWLQCQLTSADSEGNIAVVNSSHEPLLLKKDEQFCQIRPVSNALPSTSPAPEPKVLPPKLYSDPTCNISVDPAGTILSKSEVDAFRSMNQSYAEVFSEELGCYNGASGPFQHIINMGPSLPPQRRGRAPLYNRSNLELLQDKFDELQRKGVFARPEDLNLAVQYVNPSFLVKKPKGHRLVTVFSELGMYCKPQPSIMPNVDQILRQIAQWKIIVKTDLTSAYYQIPVSKSSLKYLGVVTPFRGVLVYTRAVMGLPGSEASLECLLCRVLGDLIQQGSVIIKLADDLYCGADTTEQLLATWQSVLHRLNNNGLKLSPTKTVICPTSTTVLGWLWQGGTIQASPHRLLTLANYPPPQTVTKMRSFVGAYKFLSKVIPGYTDKLDPLEKVCSSKLSQTQKINWTDELTNAFNEAKSHLKSSKTITLPRKEDQLQIITDASSTVSGLASAMYIIRNEQPRLAGVFSAKRKGSQVGWLPCEVEALSISISIKHFGPYLIQSAKKTKVLTDSKPCVEAYQKLGRGEFSNSPRVTTFLSTISHYQVELQHISGKANTFSDFISRNPAPCGGECQVCAFIERTEQSVVRSLSVTDILSGQCPVPYTTRSSWFQVQEACPNLSRVRIHLKNGTNPSKKHKGIADVKRYLNVVSLSTSPADELLIVQKDAPLRASRQQIVIPRSALDGLLTALHLKLSHPSKQQLKEVFSRAFFALDVNHAVERTSSGCHVCASLRKVPSLFKPQSTSIPPDIMGRSYSADVIQRELQKILIIRENVSAMTEATIIRDETAESLKGGLIKLLCRFRPPCSPPVSVRVDPGTGFQAIAKDPDLQRQGIGIEVGNAKNQNKNPCAEKSISELHGEIVRLKPAGGPIDEETLAIAISYLNSRIRSQSLSSVEIWTQRDMFTGKQIPVSDKRLAEQKYEERLNNHQSSAHYKSRGKEYRRPPNVFPGDLVYLFQDRDKTKARDRYLVTRTHPQLVIQKFVGTQLRSKEYVVSPTDIIKVQPFQFTSQSTYPESESSDDDYTQPTYRSAELPQRPAPNAHAMPPPNPQAVPIIPPPNEDPREAPAIPPEARPRRSSRNRLPSRLADYYLEGDEEYEA